MVEGGPALLESICILQETRCFDALAELYSMLNEEDVLFGLWKRRGAAEETRAALSCIQHGVLQQGQDYLLDAIRKAANNQFPPLSAGNLSSFSHFSSTVLVATMDRAAMFAVIFLMQTRHFFLHTGLN